MKIWFKNNASGTVTRIGHNAGDVDESFFDHLQPNPNGGFVDGELKWGMDIEFYTISKGNLVPKTKAEVDAIKADRKSVKDTGMANRKARRQRIKSRLSGLSDNQIKTYINNNVVNVDPSVNAYLERLTKIVRDAVLNLGGDR